MPLAFDLFTLLLDVTSILDEDPDLGDAIRNQRVRAMKALEPGSRLMTKMRTDESPEQRRASAKDAVAEFCRAYERIDDMIECGGLHVSRDLVAVPLLAAESHEVAGARDLAKVSRLCARECAEACVERLDRESKKVLFGGIGTGVSLALVGLALGPFGCAGAIAAAFALEKVTEPKRKDLATEKEAIHNLLVLGDAHFLQRYLEDRKLQLKKPE